MKLSYSALKTFRDCHFHYHLHYNRGRAAPDPDSLGGYSIAPFKDITASSSSHNTIFALAIHPQVPTTLYAGTVHEL